MSVGETFTFKVTITPQARARTIETLLTNGTPEGVQDARDMLLELCQLYEHYENTQEGQGPPEELTTEQLRAVCEHPNSPFKGMVSYEEEEARETYDDGTPVPDKVGGLMDCEKCLVRYNADDPRITWKRDKERPDIYGVYKVGLCDCCSEGGAWVCSECGAKLGSMHRMECSQTIDVLSSDCIRKEQA